MCVRCDNPKADPFQYAGSLLSKLLGVGGESLREEDNDDKTLYSALSKIGGPWASYPTLIFTTASGRHAGLRAVGLGSNLKKRRRGAQLALAVTALLHDEGTREKPSSPALNAVLGAVMAALHCTGGVTDDKCETAPIIAGAEPVLGPGTMTA